MLTQLSLTPALGFGLALAAMAGPLFAATLTPIGQAPPTPARAEMYVPKDDSVVVDILPSNGDASLTREPRQPQIVLRKLAERIERARQNGDGWALDRAEADLNALLSNATNDHQIQAKAHLLVGIVAQNRHDFELAEERFGLAIKRAPRLADAWLQRAMTVAAMGEPKRAAGDCRALARLGHTALAAICSASIHGLTGEAQAGYRYLQGAMNRLRLNAQMRAFGHDTLAELALRRGEVSLGIDHLKAADRINPDNLARTLRLLDLMLLDDRNEAVQDAALPKRSQPGALLRLAIARARLNHPKANGDIEAIENHLLAQARRDEPGHHSELARLTLDAKHDPEKAFEYASVAWRQQRTPEDAIVLLRAAHAANRAEGVAQVRRWVAATGLRDVRIDKLLAD